MNLLRHSLAAVAFALFAVSPAHAKYKKPSQPPLIATCIPSQTGEFALPHKDDDTSQLYQKTGIRACITPQDKIPDVNFFALTDLACALNDPSNQEDILSGWESQLNQKWNIWALFMPATELYETQWMRDGQTEPTIIRFERQPDLKCNRTFT